MTSNSSQSSLRAEANLTMDEMMMQMPMKISDAASMFRRKISPNERPYEKEIMTLNNKIVDRWYNEVLCKSTNDGTMPAGRVSESFGVFYEGLEVTQFQNFKEHLLEYPEEKVRFWIKFLSESSMATLHVAGVGIVSAAWSIVTNAVRCHFANAQWEKVYSLTTDPKKWDELADANPHVMHGRPLPFDLDLETMKGMEAKVSVMVKVLLEPTH